MSDYQEWTKQCDQCGCRLSRPDTGIARTSDRSELDALARAEGWEVWESEDVCDGCAILRHLDCEQVAASDIQIGDMLWGWGDVVWEVTAVTEYAYPPSVIISIEESGRKHAINRRPGALVRRLIGTLRADSEKNTTPTAHYDTDDPRIQPSDTPTDGGPGDG